MYYVSNCPGLLIWRPTYTSVTARTGKPHSVDFLWYQTQIQDHNLKYLCFYQHDYVFVFLMSRMSLARHRCSRSPRTLTINGRVQPVYEKARYVLDKKSWLDSEKKKEGFSFLPNVYTRYGAHPIGTRVSSSGVRRPEILANHSTPLSVTVTAPYAFIRPQG
jgi:hypothetical protein